MIPVKMQMQEMNIIFFPLFSLRARDMGLCFYKDNSLVGARFIVARIITTNFLYRQPPTFFAKN
jgi:hypothetical protein